MARILGQLPQQPASTTPPQANRGGRVLGVAPQVQNKNIVLPANQTAIDKTKQFITGSGPSFKAVEGGASSIPQNLARVASNLPSSARDLARDTLAPVNPLDINSKLNIGANIANSAITGAEIFKNRGIVGGIKDIGAGVADVVGKGADLYKGVGEKIYGALEKNVEQTGTVAGGVSKGVVDTVNTLAKVGIEDPLFIPSLLYAPSKVRATGATSDIISDIARPLLDETRNIVTKTADKAFPSLTKDVQALRTEKITKGLETQNTRLKSVGNSFDDNTIIRKPVTEGAPREIITPADTFARYNIAPEVNKGTIEMGDYQKSIGPMGKLRTEVENIETKLDDVFKNSTQPVPLESYRQAAIAKAQANEQLKASGKIQQTVDTINKRFDDFKQSYGEAINTKDVRQIQKASNRDFDMATQDASRVIGDTSRDLLYNATPDGAIKKLLQEQGELLAARNYAEVINGTKVVGGRLGNYVMRTLGATIGSTVTGLPLAGPLIGAVGGEFAARALQQAQFKSLGAEARALFQNRSSKIKDVTNKAKSIPSKAIDVSNSTPPRSSVKFDAKPNSKGFVNFNAPLRSKPNQPSKIIPTKLDGVKIGNRTIKSIDEPSKKELTMLMDYINLKQPFNQIKEEMIEKYNQKFNIPIDTSSNKIADYYGQLVENTQTTRLVPGRDPIGRFASNK